jgi:clan AA aspartic protease
MGAAVICGGVVAQRGPVIPLIVFDEDDGGHAMSALVDTGFSGWLSLPAKVIASLRLSWRKEAHGVLADGGSTFFDVFVAEIVWDGQRRRVYVSELDTDPMVGMGLLNGFRFTMDAIDGGAVEIERLA